MLSHFSLNRLVTTASVAALSVTLSLFAQPAQKASAQLSGSGATSIQPLINDWFTSRGASYNPNGSGTGRSDFQKTLTDFVSTDLTLPVDLLVINAVNIPVGFVYNVPDFNVSLSTEQVIGIINGSITNWSELGGPDLPITFVYRSDNSGTTTILNGFVQANGGGLSVPPFPVGIGVSGSSNIISTVQSTEGAIGYVDIPAALQAGLPIASLDTTIKGPNYIVFRRFYSDPSKAAAAKDLCLYLTGPDAAQVASDLGYDVSSSDPSACDGIQGP